MTKTVDISEVENSIQSVIALTRNGDEIIIEDNGRPKIKITSLEEPAPVLSRKLDLGAESGYFMSDDFDDELPDEFWGFDKGFD